MGKKENVCNIEYRWNEKQYLTHDTMVQLLKKFGDLIPDPMSERVDLDEYADKWLKFADFLFALDKNEVIGIRILYANDTKTKSAHGLLLSILPAYQGLGIGRQLYLQTIKFVKQRGMERIFLYVHYKNIPAINLYKSLGFKEVSINLPKIKMCLEIT